MFPALRTRTILVVEDDHSLRELYRSTLIGAGYSVVAVEDGIDALRFVEGHTPSLIVLDLGLPRLDGRDVQRELASHPETRDIPILVVTGSDTRELRAGDFNGVLSKPVTSDILLTAIERALQTARRWKRRSSAAQPQAGNLRYPVPTVLVVDDEISMQALVRDFLEDKGYSVKTAGSVGDAISVLEHSSIDAVIVDVRMPRRSGLELLEFIRLDKKRRNVPVLILTGATLAPDERAVIQRESGYLFYKSGKLEALADRLDQVIH